MAASSENVGSTGPTAPVSFGFSRKAERRKLLATGPCSEPDGESAGNESADTDYLTAVEDRELLSAKPAPPPPKDLVIPLRPSHRWRNPEAPSSAPSSPGHAPKGADHAPKGADHAPDAAGHAPEGDPVTLETAAVQELLREARQSREQGLEPPIAAPIPMRMKEENVGSGALPTPEDYEAVPVAAFGMAMLRGMGWKQGEGIGRTFKRVVKPLEHRLRPRGLGLGAEPAPPPNSTGGGGGRREDPPSNTGGGLKVGDDVRIESGPHRGVYGKVEALDPETARAVVRLQLGGQAVTVSQHGLIAQRAPSAPPRRPPGSEEGSQPAPPPPKTQNSGNGKRKRSPERLEQQSRAPPHWLRRDLRVRCIDRGFRGGRYYNCKMQVEDMLSPHSCVCRTDDGRLVEGLQESMLETVIPRGPNDRIMVVLGQHGGQVGRILERDPKRGQAVVRLKMGVIELAYDSLCHYIGGDDEDVD